MMARSTTRSNERPDTLMEDPTSARSTKPSCDARPDHTYGSRAAVLKTPADRPVTLRYPPTCCTAANWREVPNPAVTASQYCRPLHLNQQTVDEWSRIERGFMFAGCSSHAKSLWSQNIPKAQGVRPTFQAAFFEMAFASSSPTSPARQVRLWSVVSPHLSVPIGVGTPRRFTIIRSKCFFR